MDLEKASRWAGMGGIVGALIFVAPVVATAGGISVVISAAAGAIGTGAGAGGAVGAAVALAHEFVLSKLRGKVVQILGPKQSGKNSVYDAIVESHDGEVDPTSESTKKLYENSSRAELKILADKKAPPGFFKDIYEVSGESVTKWKELIEETNPHGIIYVTNSSTEYRVNSYQDARFYLEAEGLYEVCQIVKKLRTRDGKKNNLKAFLILVNKADKTPEERDILADEYRNKLEKYNLKSAQIQSGDKNLFEFLKNALGSSVPISVEYFCADYHQRRVEPYRSHNSEVILSFWKELLR